MATRKMVALNAVVSGPQGEKGREGRKETKGKGNYNDNGAAPL